VNPRYVTDCATGFELRPQQLILSNTTPEVKASNMPSQTTLSIDEKTKIKSAIPVYSYKIHTAALARIYFAYPQPTQWLYGGLQGALAFVLEKDTGIFSLKMVDLAGTRGVIWEHELYEGFEYHQDRPFFHSFAGDVSQDGL
jgi:neural Wiskott-Aldrich syndrome protein